jgi:thymidine phosphorylase
MVGNALEIEECVEVLRGEGPKDLRELSLLLAAWMFFLGGRSASVEEGKALAEQTVSSGRAFEKFREIIQLQGGDARVMDDPKRLPQAQHRVEVNSPAAGYVGSIECRQVGIASCVLGGGREKKEDRIDPAVGLVVHKRIGDSVARGEPLCTIYYNSDARVAEAHKLLEASYRIAPAPPTVLPPLVHRALD